MRAKVRPHPAVAQRAHREHDAAQQARRQRGAEASREGVELPLRLLEQQAARGGVDVLLARGGARLHLILEIE